MRWWPSVDDLIFSLKSFAGAMLSLYLAQKIGLPRPFWAPVAAYVVSQPLAGAVRSKALYRFVGTFIGATAITILVPTFINYTILFAIVVGCWFALCLFISLNDRTPRSYAFLLGGYTVGLVTMPSLIDMSTFGVEAIIDLAVARAEEIFLGVGCAALIHSIVLPRGVGKVVVMRLDEMLRNSQGWLKTTLGSVSGKEEVPKTFTMTQLAGAITEIRMMSHHLVYDTDNAKWANNLLGEMQDRLASLVPIVTALEERVKIITRDAPLPVEWQELFNDMTDWISRGLKGTDPHESINLRHRIAAMMPDSGPQSSWRDMQFLNLGAVSNSLIDESERCFDIRRKVNAGLAGKIPDDETEAKKVSPLSLYVDRQMSIASAFAAGMSMVTMTIFWAVSGWPSGFAAPMMAGMYCMFFAAFDSPVPLLKIQFYNTLWSSPVTGLYILLLCPSAHSFEMLMLVWAPFLIYFGCSLSTPQGAVRVIPFMFTVLANMMMFDLGSANMTSFINAQISQALGVGSAALFMGVFRTASLDAIIRRLVRNVWGDISALGRRETPPLMVGVTVKMVDSIAVLAPRMANAKNSGLQSTGVAAAAHLLKDVRIAVSMAWLISTTSRLPESTTVRSFLNTLSDFYEKRRAETDPYVLLPDIDRTLFRLTKMPKGEDQMLAIACLAGIRMELCPDAPHYRPPEETEPAAPVANPSLSYDPS